MTPFNDIKIMCTNGYELTATLYSPSNLKGAVMIAPATGIKRQFYTSFASFLADNGYGVITFDNQGIGDSQNENLKNSNASLISWGQSDMSAVFESLKSHFSNVKYHLVGHSAGGQLVGLMDGVTELTSVFNVACSSGSISNIKYPFKLKAHFLMTYFIPLSNLLFGFTNTQWMGMGEPLPKKCAQQWADWCKSTGYVKTYLDTNNIKHFYNELKCPSLWINATDDSIANNENVKDMLRVFPNLNATTLTLDPKERDLKEIGHMRFFSKRSKKVWAIAIDWFATNSKPTEQF